jgi:outer membrane protein assembly factor BamB
MAPAAWLVLLGLVPQDPDAREATRYFALPMARDTQELADAAKEHAEAGRYTEAVQALQRMLERHAHEVLAATRAGGASSTHVGATEWALAQLRALPEPARREYQARFGPRAAEALAQARAAPTRANLAAIPRFWPLTGAAIEAWWALGDFELESGRQEAAAQAYRRAQALAVGLGARTERSPARESWLAARGADSTLREPPAPSLPRGEAEHWSRPLDLTPFNREGPAIGRNLQPIALDDLVLVGTTLRLYALDAYSGALRWEAGPPPGWSALSRSAEASLFDGVADSLLYLAPAAENGIVVAVLQEPFTEYESDEWQSIQIMVAIPERRLHAYDIATGRELWNHAPPLAFDARERRWTWDGGGSYAQRMMVAGSPVLAGARVLVPCYRMQGRIDYHVACYELATGELLWSTPVVSGQRERNMFGRSVSEFCAAPLTVVGDRVLAQSELGTIASLDLFTGNIQWQATYPQIPLPKTRAYNAGSRNLTWRLTPPLVQGELILATPSDSEELVALRLADGAFVWSYPEEHLQALDHKTRQLGFRQLLGADESTLFLAGSKLTALQKPGGLASSAPFSPQWTEVVDRPDSSPRAQLFGAHVVAPNSLRREVYDRRTGARLAALSGSWSGGEVGNLCLVDGALFSLSNQGISGYFDWGVRLEQARRSAGPSAEAEVIGSAARLFVHRARLCLEEGALEEAQDALEEARTLYQRLRTRQPEVERAAELDCSALLAEILFRRQRGEAALSVLAEARRLARTPVELLPLLLREERIQRARGGPSRLAVLEEIEASAGEALLGADARLEAVLAWLPRTVTAGEPDPEAHPIPLRTWVALERAHELQRAGELGAALQDLHRALWGCGALELVPGVTLAALVRERIASLLALPEGPAAYAPFESEAGQLLEAARAQGAELAFEHVLSRYPHSAAAEAALLVRLDALEDGLASARLLVGALSLGGWNEERASDLLVRLATALGGAGNEAFETGLLGALARSRPEARSPLDAHGGRTLRQLAAEHGREPAVPSATPVRFRAGLTQSGNPLVGTAEFVGALRPDRQAPESAPIELHIYARRDELLAFSIAAPSEPAWRVALEEPLIAPTEQCALAPGLFLLGTRERLACLDEGGHERWSHPSPDDPVRAVRVESGVALARLRSNRVLAFDALFGLPLWSRTLEAGGDWSGPLAGEGRAVFFQPLAAQGTRVFVLELFRGRVLSELRLASQVQAPEESAWIAAGRLIVPEFQERPARLGAYALDDGRRAWTIEFGRDEELYAVLHSEGRAFPVTLAATLDAGTTNGGVYELDESLGSVRRLLPLKPGERLLGLTASSTLELQAPYVFPFTYAESERSVPIRAVHLAQGLAWSWSLPIAPQEVYDPRNLALPAVSEELVALAYQARRPGGAPSAEATIVLLDKRTGRKVDTLLLADPFGQSNRLSLRGLGSALFVTGHGSPTRGAGLSILETHR